MAKPDPVVRVYSLQAPIYDWTRWAVLLGRRRLLRRLALRTGQRVLDVGCGTGYHVARVARAVGPGGSALGIDCTPAMLRRARRRARGLPNVELVEGRFPDPVGPTSGFDAIVMSYVLTLAPDWRAALEHARDRLAPGGRLAVLDFLTAPSSPARMAIRAHGVALGPERREWLRANLDVELDEEHRAFGGLWRWHLTVATPP